MSSSAELWAEVKRESEAAMARYFGEAMKTNNDIITTTIVTWYVARNHLGEFSRGEGWTKDIAKARFHKKVGPVRTAITKWTKRHPDLPVPQILEWKCDIATARIMDETARTENAISRMKRRAVERQMRDAKFKREMLEREIARHQEELKKLHERNPSQT